MSIVLKFKNLIKENCMGISKKLIWIYIISEIG